MAKLQTVLLLLALTLAICQAEPQRSRYLSRQRTRYLSRQEEAAVAVADAAPAVTPYPTADELKPEVPFEEVAPLPDEVYGPPAPKPDEVYGPPEVDGNELPAADPAAEPFPAPLDDQQARLIAARRAARLRQRQIAAYRQSVAARAARPAPAKLRAPQQQRRFA